MAFVVRLQSAHLEPEPGQQVHPLFRMAMPAAVERGLTRLEKLATADRLRMAGAVGPDAFDRYRVYFPGGRVAEAKFPNLNSDARCTGGTLTADGPFPQLAHLAFDLAAKVGFVLVPDGVNCPVAVTEDIRQNVLLRWPNVRVVPTVHTFWRMIAPPDPDPEPEAEKPDADGVTAIRPAAEPAAAPPPAPEV